MDLKMNFFELMNSAVFRKTLENIRKHRDIKLALTEARRDYSVSEPKCHAATFFIKIY